MVEMIHVTQILSPFADYSRIPQPALEHAAARGSLLHDAAAEIARGNWVPELDGDAQRYVDSFELWFNSYVTEVVSVEENFICEEFGYTGTWDVICRLMNDRYLALIDYKTPAIESPTWCAQLAAYEYGARKKYHPERVAALKLRPGRPAKMIQYNQGHRDFAAFLAALTAYRYFKGWK